MQFNDFERKVLDESTSLLRAITHPTRIALLNFIIENQPVKVFEIHTTLNLDQSITSQHLRILRESGIVQTTRRGKFIYYNVESVKLYHAGNAILNIDKLTLNSRKRKI